MLGEPCVFKNPSVRPIICSFAHSYIFDNRGALRKRKFLIFDPRARKKSFLRGELSQPPSASFHSAEKSYKVAFCFDFPFLAASINCFHFFSKYNRQKFHFVKCIEDRNFWPIFYEHLLKLLAKVESICTAVFNWKHER